MVDNYWIGTPPFRRDWPQDPPQCEHEVMVIGSHIVQYRKKHYGPRWKLCSFPARCVIDGRNYCARHGGEIALRKLLGEE